MHVDTSLLCDMAPQGRDAGSPAPATPAAKTALPRSADPLIPADLKLQRSAAAQIANGFALLCICVMASAVRLFSVIKYESVIHEFDPYFNYRVTQYLTKNGFYNMWNWFDDRTWYPLGRVVGGTVYPVSLLYSFAWLAPCITPANQAASALLAVPAKKNQHAWALIAVLLWIISTLCWFGLGMGVKALDVLQGLIYTAGLMHNILHALNIPLHVQEVRSSCSNVSKGLCLCYLVPCFGLSSFRKA